MKSGLYSGKIVLHWLIILAKIISTTNYKNLKLAKMIQSYINYGWGKRSIK